MFNILSKFKVTDGLEVTIRQDKPYTVITCTIAESEDGADDKVIAAVMEAFYQEHYRDRARKEAIEDVKAVAEAAKNQADKAMPTLVNGNTQQTIVTSVIISDDRQLFPGDYAAIVEYLPEIKIGEKYKNGQYVKIKDNKLPADNQAGQYVCVRLNKGNDWQYNGEDILATPNPYKNGYDIRRYESYPRVQLGTATDTKINK